VIVTREPGKGSVFTVRHPHLPKRWEASQTYGLMKSKYKVYQFHEPL